MLRRLEIMSGFATAAIGMFLLLLLSSRPMSEPPWYAVAAVSLAPLAALVTAVGVYLHVERNKRWGLFVLGSAAVLALAAAFFSALSSPFVLLALLTLMAALLGAGAELSSG
jgi:hypothetical protein